MKPRVIDEDRLRQIVAEELKRVHEAVDHEGVRNVVNAASKLLKAAEAFKEEANGPAMSAVTPHLDHLVAALEDMVNTPASYVEKQKVAPRVVRLRPTKDAV